MNLEITLHIHGTTHQLSVDTRTTLLDALRERLGLTGAKKGCDHGQCGACTILLGGRRANSCLALAVAHQDATSDTSAAVAALAAAPNGAFLGGGTNFVDLMKLGVATPDLLVDVTRLSSPLGAKGIGEIGIVGTAAAIANAVYHATGIRVRDLPIRADRLL